MVHIEEVRASIADDVALANLLAASPFPPSAHDLIRKPFLGRRWLGTRGSGYWLASDGVHVVLLKITGVDAALITRLRMRFDELRRNDPALEPSSEVLRGLLATLTREDRLLA